MSVDGISIMNNLITTTPVQPMIEAIQEVEIQTGTYSAQYGAYLGVHINMITKSGTNQLHGSLFEFLNNQVLNARNYFTLPTPANPTAAKPPLRQNQYGIEVDGPVMIPKLYDGRNKTFFMASFEGINWFNLRPRFPPPCRRLFSQVISPRFPTGSITGGVIKDPLNGNTPFAGNIIPTSRISPVVSKLQHTIREPTCRDWPAITQYPCPPRSPPTRPWIASTRILATKSVCTRVPTTNTSMCSAAARFPRTPRPRPLPFPTTRSATRKPSHPTW